MKELCVFVFLLCAACASDGIVADSCPGDLTGRYISIEEPESPITKLFSYGQVKGWDYNDPEFIEVILNADSTYKMNTCYGGFEGPSYIGSWTRNKDSLCLYYIQSVPCCGGSASETEPLGADYTNLLLIKPGKGLEIVDLIRSHKGRFLKHQ